MAWVVACQLVLLAYHQISTLVDLHPFNGARNYARHERLAESGVNAVLMSLPPIGFALQIHGLMLFGAIYYLVLLTFEITIWWVPYFTVPSGRWRKAYNCVLAVATSNFEKGDTLDKWLTTYKRIHADTLTLLPRRSGRVTPNVEHMILHGWTLLTAVVTLCASFCDWGALR
jgi:hypothetical protein